jgi:predicted secreted protein
MAQNGSTIVLYVNTGSSGSPVYTLVGGQRDLSVTEKVGTIDVSDKSSAKAQFLYGRYEATIDLDALYTEGDASYTALRSAVRNRTNLLVRRYNSGVAKEEATVLVTQIAETYKDQDAAMFSISLQVTGDWTEL